jgi:hypothetical protein
LRAILRIFQEEFVVKADKPNHCSLETRSPSLNGRRLFFAAAKVKKNYISYYLPALYMFPSWPTAYLLSCEGAYTDNSVLTSLRWIRTASPSWKN